MRHSSETSKIYKDLTKAYFEKIEKIFSFNQEQNSPSKEKITESAQALFDKIFDADHTHGKYYAQLMFQWYIKESFKDYSFQKVLNIFELIKTEIPSPKKALALKTYEDFLITKNMPYIIAKKEIPLAVFLPSNDIEPHPKNYIKLKIIYFSLQENAIKLSEVRKNENKDTSITLSNLTENQFEDFKKIYIELKKNIFENKDPYNSIAKEIFKDLKLKVEKIYGRKIIPNFEDLDLSVLEKIKNQIFHDKTIKEKLNFIANVFETKIMINLSINESKKNYSSLNDPNKKNYYLLEEDISKISKNALIKIDNFLGLPDIPIFEDFVIGLTGTVEKIPKHNIFYSADSKTKTLTAHEMLKLKKEFHKNSK